MQKVKGERPKDKGTDLPSVIIPGIQGHAEWMTPAIEALRQTRDVRTFSLNVEDGARDPFAQWVQHIDAAITDLGAERVAVIGVSFGGLVAMHYAATRPERTAALVLVSAPSPRMTLGQSEALLVNRPLVLLPMFPWFAARALQRLLPEVWTAIETWPARLRFLAAYGWQVTRRPMDPWKSARWVREWQARDLASECGRIQAPTRVITGDDTLDRVVPASSTRDYLSLIPGATAYTFAHTGHIGLVTQPAAFAALVDEFLNGLDSSRSRRSA